jgi:7-cyano-7-deazaguanine synthase in queuosine biosynthesis
MAYDLLILYSGGADSRLMLEMARDSPSSPFFLLVDYGQRTGELEVALNHIGFKDYRYVSVVLGSSVLTDGGGDYQGVSRYYVPGRNLALVSMAFSLAESMGIDTIWIGCDASDTVNGFPDCTSTWIKKVNDLFAINGSRKINLVAPLIDMTKDEVVSGLAVRGIGMDTVFSGYGGL